MVDFSLFDPYILSIGNVGLEILSFEPIFIQIFLIRVVFPEPKSPSNNTVFDFMFLSIKFDALLISFKWYEKIIYFLSNTKERLSPENNKLIFIFLPTWN